MRVFVFLFVFLTAMSGWAIAQAGTKDSLMLRWNSPLQMYGAIVSDVIPPGDYVLRYASLEFYPMPTSGLTVWRMTADRQKLTYRFVNRAGVGGYDDPLGRVEVHQRKPFRLYLYWWNAEWMVSLRGR